MSIITRLEKAIMSPQDDVPSFLKRERLEHEPNLQVDADVRVVAEANNVAYEPTPVLPEEIERLANASKAGRFAAEAVAREYLQTAKSVEDHGVLYEEHAKAAAASLRALADDMEKDGADKRAKSAEDAAHIRENAASVLKWIENRSALATDMNNHFTAIRQRIEQSLDEIKD